MERSGGHRPFQSGSLGMWEKNERDQRMRRIENCEDKPRCDFSGQCGKLLPRHGVFPRLLPECGRVAPGLHPTAQRLDPDPAKEFSKGDRTHFNEQEKHSGVEAAIHRAPPLDQALHLSH